MLFQVWIPSLFPWRPVKKILLYENVKARSAVTGKQKNTFYRNCFWVLFLFEICLLLNLFLLFIFRFLFDTLHKTYFDWYAVCLGRFISDLILMFHIETAVSRYHGRNAANTKISIYPVLSQHNQTWVKPETSAVFHWAFKLCSQGCYWYSK